MSKTKPSIRLGEDVGKESINTADDSDEEYDKQLLREKMSENRHIHQIRQWFLYGSAIFSIAIVFAYLWNLLAFPCLRWLNLDEL